MAKLCSSYGSSPNLYQPYMSDLHCSSTFEDSYECSVFKPDHFELFGELNTYLPSISNDIKKLESDETEFFAPLDLDSFEQNFDEFDMKTGLRNVDCMWSATTNATLSSSVKSNGSDGVGVAATAVPMAVVNNAKRIQTQQQQSNNSKAQQQQQTAGTACDIDIKTEIKTEPHDDYEQHSNTAAQLLAQTPSSMQHIPPGTSLLRKSNTQQQQQQQQRKQPQQKLGANNTSIQIPKMYTAEFITERDHLSNGKMSGGPTMTAMVGNASPTAAGGAFTRPDTPHSLDDDATGASSTGDFKPIVDLRACLTGSNNISLTADPTKFIDHLSKQLQDTSKTHIDMRFANGGSSLAEVFDVIGKDTIENFGGGGGGGGGSSSDSRSSHLRSSVCDWDEESMPDSCDSDRMYDMDHQSNNASGSNCSSSSSTSGSSISVVGKNAGRTYQQPYLHSDHSYTRCNEGMDDGCPSLETPSESDEEIDVVSVGDKKLPTNPSDKERRLILTQVAHKFSSKPRIVKTANGVRTIPPRRRSFYELPYTPASSSPVKSVANSRYPSPASTPYQTQYTTTYVQQQQKYAGLNADGLSGIMSVDKARKRVNGTHIVNGVEYCALPPHKKQRGKKSSSSSASSKHFDGHNTTIAASLSMPVVGSKSCSGAASIFKRNASFDESPDSIEKRNLHNDMERQRRIGLKNLFEALKKQIPSIKDKERAPKVNILREAAKLCDTLVREDQHLCDQKAHLKEELRRRQELLSRMRMLQRD